MDLTANSHTVIEGQFVSVKVERIVQAIKDYEPEIDVQWIPVGARKEGQAAFRIVHNAPGRPPYVLMHVKSEDEFDERVLMKIIMNDQRNGKVTMSELEAFEATQRHVQQVEWEDKMAEAHDIAFHALRTPLNTYRVNKDLVIKDGIPFNAKGY